ncbi:tripartite tricarboxylate transporter substrate binding protein [Aquabacter sp. CN5-332]|uniref:Bug family tripartite tricarboxylate transporter substrate binding protein n=1 Tax=Aquabacter sp. CN5-332 TaxID=3156608 RepID=UPI0032B583BE
MFRKTRIISKLVSCLLIGGAGFAVGSAEVRAADFPTRAIRIICPFAPGASIDVLARAYAKEMTETLGQPVVVENRPGANGVLASTTVAKQPGDGYTLLFTTGSHVSNAALSATLPYRPVDDFTPIFLAAQSYGLAVISNKFSSIPELVAAAKANPGKLTYATLGTGNVTHVAGALFAKQAGINITDVPYNSPTMNTDLMGGQVDMAFMSTVSAVPLIKSGKVKALATTGTLRPPTLPDVPTLKQLGYADYEVTGYFGIFGPAQMPPEIVTILYNALRKAQEAKDVKALLAESSLYAGDIDPKGFDKYVRDDLTFQTNLMKELGIQQQ